MGWNSYKTNIFKMKNLLLEQENDQVLIFKVFCAYSYSNIGINEIFKCQS
jgi:hypothetical protein